MLDAGRPPRAKAAKVHEIGGLCVWVDGAQGRIMLGNHAAASAWRDQALAVPPQDLPAPPDHSDVRFDALGTYALGSGPRVGLRIAQGAAARDRRRMAELLAAMAVPDRPEVTLDYAPDLGPAHALWRDGTLIRHAPRQPEPGAPGMQLLLEMMRLLLAGRRVLAVLHGSAVLWRGARIVFMGQSDAGKSTLAAQLVGDGGVYLGDDYVALDGSGQIVPLPLAPSIKSEPGRSSPRCFPDCLSARCTTRVPNPCAIWARPPMPRTPAR